MDILGAASALPFGTDGAADDGSAEYVYRFAPLVGIYGGTLEVFRNMIGAARAWAGQAELLTAGGERSPDSASSVNSRRCFPACRRRQFTLDELDNSCRGNTPRGMMAYIVCNKQGDSNGRRRRQHRRSTESAAASAGPTGRRDLDDRAGARLQGRGHTARRGFARAGSRRIQDRRHRYARMHNRKRRQRARSR